MRTYLSIDLDYWFREDNYNFDSLYKLLEFVGTIPDRIIVQEHQEIVSHIDFVNPDHILHVDYHQDIAYPYYKGEVFKICCGSFFYFIKNRKEKTFKWFYPEYDTCIVRYLGICVDKYYHPFAKKNFIFKEQKMKCGMPTKKELTSVVACSISLSQDYSCYRYDIKKHAVKALRMLYKLFDEDKVRDIINSYYKRI